MATAASAPPPPRAGAAARRTAAGVWTAVLLVGLVPPLSAGRRGWPFPGLRISELLTVLLGGVVIGALGLRRPASWRVPALAVAYALLTTILGAIDLKVRHGSFNASNLGGLLGPWQYVLFATAVYAAGQEPADRRRLVAVAALASVPTALIAILQALGLFGLDHAALTFTGTHRPPDQGTFRVTGPFTHWQVLAGYLLVVIILTTASWSRDAEFPVRGRLLAVVMVLNAIALACTVTIGVAVIAVLAVASLVNTTNHVTDKRRGWAVALVAALIVGGGLTTLRKDAEFGPSSSSGQEQVVPQTLDYRVKVWRDQYWPVVKHHWVSGYGPDLPSSITHQYTESIYITMLMRGGVILLVSYVALMLAVAQAAFRLRDGPGEVRGAGAAALAIVGWLALAQVIQPYFTQSGAPQLIWLSFALVVAAATWLATTTDGPSAAS